MAVTKGLRVNVRSSNSDLRKSQSEILLCLLLTAFCLSGFEEVPNILRTEKEDDFAERIVRTTSVRLSEDEAIDERILGIKVECISPGERCRPRDLGNDGIVRTELLNFYSSHRHRAAKNTFDRDLLVEMQITLGMVQRGASAYARARG